MPFTNNQLQYGSNGPPIFRKVWDSLGEKPTARAAPQVDAKPVRRRGIALFAYKNREEARLWKPKRPVLAQLDRLTAQRARLVKVIKMLQTPLTDSEGFIDKADRKATAPAARQQACKASLKALKADRYGGPAESS